MMALLCARHPLNSRLSGMYYTLAVLICFACIEDLQITLNPEDIGSSSMKTRQLNWDGLLIYLPTLNGLGNEARSLWQRPKFRDLVAPEYPVEVHNVYTEDGYILDVHRIPYGRQGRPGGPRPAVMIMHGMLGASGNFIYDPGYSIAYTLADAGFDVWLGNARGNLYSYRHQRLNPDNFSDKRKFFDFSWHEIGIYDLPAMVDYILATTRQKKIHYVGHSQGGTVFFVLNSMRPQYNNKFQTAHLLSPAGHQKHGHLYALRVISRVSDVIYKTKKILGLVDVFVDSIGALERILNKPILQWLWSDLVDMIYAGKYHGTYGLLPAAASLKQFAHYAQNIRDRQFRQWDYGYYKNKQIYGKSKPPIYDLRLVNVKTTLYGAMSDPLVSAKDVEDMARDMPNGRMSVVKRYNFTHLSYLLSEDVKSLVTDHIIREIKNVVG